MREFKRNESFPELNGTEKLSFGIDLIIHSCFYNQVAVFCLAFDSEDCKRTSSWQEQIALWISSDKVSNPVSLFSTFRKELTLDGFCLHVIYKQFYVSFILHLRSNYQPWNLIRYICQPILILEVKNISATKCLIERTAKDPFLLLVNQNKVK